MKLRILVILLLLALAGNQAMAAGPVNVGLSDVIAAVEKSFQSDSSGQLPISDFTADFFQRTFLAREKREMRGDGRLAVRMPAGGTPLMFHFEYYRPTQQEIISNGRSMWIYHPENREVILSDVSFLYSRPGFDPSRDQAVNFLQGLGRISRDFQINFAGGMYDTAGNYVLELNPRRAMLNTRRILLVVNRASVLERVAAKSAPKEQFNAPQPPPLPQQKPAMPQMKQPFPQQKSAFATAPFGQFSSTSNDFPILSTTMEDHDGNSTTMEFTNIRVNSRLPWSEFNFTVPGNVQVIRPSERNLPR